MPEFKMLLKTRNYAKEEAACVLPRQSVSEHPLSHPAVGLDKGRHLTAARTLSPLEQEDARPQESSFDDPLRSSSWRDASSVNDIQPLSRPSRRVVRPTFDEQADAAAAEWDGNKVSIMQRFTSTGTITVSANFDIISKEPKGRGKSQIAAHLEELEDPDNLVRQDVKIISQQEYVTRLRELNDEIAQAWLSEERVAALRLSIRVARLLSDTSVPQFYPTLFVLVTDVMDTVGNLVWNRIKKKAETDESGNVICSLPVNFTMDDVRQEAKDTCANWFYKIGSIRELLPRIYMEIAILRCVQFLERDPPLSSFQRLTRMMRGLADPLAAAYAHVYLARRGQALVPPETGSHDALKTYSAIISLLGLPVPAAMPQGNRGYLISGLSDYLLLFRRVVAGEFDQKAGVDRRLYMSLIEPAIEWVMHCCFKHANQDDISMMVKVFGECQLLDKAGVQRAGEPVPLSVVVYHLLKQLPSTFVGNHSLTLSKIVRNSADLSMPQHLNYRALGVKLCQCSPPRELRLAVLNDVWKVVMKYTELVDYLSVADVFTDYILQNCKDVELNIMLRDVVKHVKKDEVNDVALALLESIVFKLVTHSTDLTHLLTMDYFVGLLDVFYGDTRRSVYKRIMESVSRNNQTFRDPVTRHFIFELAKVLHDSLDSLSSDDDRRQITRLVVRFVQLVDFGRDLEQHLSFLVDCRTTFSNMDSLRETVIHASNVLAVRALKLVKGFHTIRTSEFVKACVTFNEITIPSLDSVVTRANLFLETAEVALLNALPSHADGLVKSAITSLQELQNEDELRMGESSGGVPIFLQKLLSFLVVLPGHPELGVLYIFNGLLTVLDSHPWLIPGRKKTEVLCGILCAIAALSQDSLPYHVDSDQVDSNDSLYYGEATYFEELSVLSNAVVEKIIVAVDEPGDPIGRGNKLLDACNTVLMNFQVNTELKSFCSSLLDNAGAILPQKTRYLVLTRSFASCRGGLNPA